MSITKQMSINPVEACSVVNNVKFQKFLQRNFFRNIGVLSKPCAYLILDRLHRGPNQVGERLFKNGGSLRKSIGFKCFIGYIYFFFIDFLWFFELNLCTWKTTRLPFLKNNF